MKNYPACKELTKEEHPGIAIWNASFNFILASTQDSGSDQQRRLRQACTSRLVWPVHSGRQPP